MKRMCALLLCFCLTTIAGFALADASVLRREGQFSVHFTNDTVSETHAMALRQGDRLEIQAFLTDGSAIVTVKHNNGEILYSGIGDDAPGFSLAIPSTEIYRITIAGDNAVGSVRVYAPEAREESDSGDPPFRLERIVSDMGYMIEYDPDFFTYGQSHTREREIFTADTEENMPEAFVWVAREPLSLEAAVDETLAMEGFVELEPSMVDFHAARTLRHQQGSAPDSLIIRYTLVEMGESEVFYLVASYYVAVEENFVAKVDRMVESLRFTR